MLSGTGFSYSFHQDRTMTYGNEMLDALRAVLPGKPGIAVVHSSLSTLMVPHAFNHFRSIEAVDQLSREGWTIALPAFTFSFCGGQPYNVRDSVSEVGQLATWVLKGLPFARRTLNPIYSFVVVGPQSDSICMMAGASTFGSNTPFEYFEHKDAQIVMLGCGWKYCTQFHRYEELATVPYRYFKTFEGEVVTGTSVTRTSTEMYVRDLELDPKNDFSAAVRQLEEQNALRKVGLWRGSVEVVATSDLAATCRRQLAANPFAYLSNGPLVAAKLLQRRAKAKEEPIRVAVLGQSNVEFLRIALEESLAEWIPDRKVTSYAVPYGQLAQEVLSDVSDLAKYDPQFAFFFDRLEDLLAKPFIDPNELDLVRDQVEHYARIIRFYRARAKGWVIVCRFAAMQPTAHDADAITHIVAEMNRLLSAALEDLPQLAWIDVAREAGLTNTLAVDARLWHLGRFPYSKDFSKALGCRAAGLVLAATGRTARLIVLDLDNTIWGGVLGEDGIEGIIIGDDYPGNTFTAFQRVLKSLSKRGVALAIASKNDEDLALKAIDEKPGMEIRSRDIVGHRINWQPKSENIQSLCDELGLGCGSVLFVDDNPVECEAVRRNLPEIKVLQLPCDSSDYANALMSSPWLNVIAVTNEDKRRVASYHARKKALSQRKNAASLEDFYAQLGMCVYIQPLDDNNLARVVQLCNKTNQFTTTTRRYEATDLNTLVRSGADVIVIGLSDNLNERENIGVLVLKAHPQKDSTGEIDLLLLSCRVLGRGLEKVIVSWARRRASERGWPTLTGRIIETDRNTPVRKVFEDNGFKFEPATAEWSINSDRSASHPSWFSVQESLSSCFE